MWKSTFLVRKGRHNSKNMSIVSKHVYVNMCGALLATWGQQCETLLRNKTSPTAGEKRTPNSHQLLASYAMKIPRDWQSSGTWLVGRSVARVIDTQYPAFSTTLSGVTTTAPPPPNTFRVHLTSGMQLRNRAFFLYGKKDKLSSEAASS